MIFRWSIFVLMRNRIVHAYFGVDEEIIWKIVKSDLPELTDRLQALLYP